MDDEGQLMDVDAEQRIRDRAYEIWIREGQPVGRHVQHWHQARAEIAAERPENKAAAVAGAGGTGWTPAVAAPSPPPEFSRYARGRPRRRSGAPLSRGDGTRQS